MGFVDDVFEEAGKLLDEARVDVSFGGGEPFRADVELEEAPDPSSGPVNISFRDQKTMMATLALLGLLLVVLLIAAIAAQG